MAFIESNVNWVKLPDDEQMSDDFDLFYSPFDKRYFAYRDRHSSENGFSFCIEAGSKMRAVSEAVSVIEAYVIQQENKEETNSA